MSDEGEQALGFRKFKSIIVPAFVPANADLKDTKVYSDYPGKEGSVLLAIVPVDPKQHPYLIKNGRRVTIKPKLCVYCKKRFWRFTGKHKDSTQCGKCHRTLGTVGTYV